MQQVLDYVTSHWAIFLTVCGTIVSIVYLKLDARYARQTDVKESLAHVQKKHDELENRVDRVEQELPHLPRADDVVALRVAVKEMKGETTALHATIKGLSRLVDLLVEKEVKGDR